MNTLECRYHSIDISGTLNASVHSPTGHLSNHLITKEFSISIKHTLKFASQQFMIEGKGMNLLNRLVMILWVQKLSDAKFLCC